jgi:hypothetical protein
MKKWMTQLQCFWIFCVQFALLISTTAAAAYPADSLSLNKSEQANYMSGRYVIGQAALSERLQPTSDSMQLLDERLLVECRAQTIFCYPVSG